MKKLRIGIVGLGRLGKVHAQNIAYKIPNAELTAACSIVPAELEYAKQELGVTDVYTDYREMLAKADIDAYVNGDTIEVSFRLIGDFPESYTGKHLGYVTWI